MNETHQWYSGKCKLHEYEYVASVLPTGLCKSRSDHARVRQSDAEVCESRSEVHKFALSKQVDYDKLKDIEEDIGVHEENF